MSRGPDGCNAIVAAFPDTDILVNNAGGATFASFFESKDSDWEQQFQFNVMSGVRLSRSYMQGMLKRDWGPHRFHLFGVGDTHSQRDDPLRL